MGYEYEIVTHKNIPGLQIFLVDLLYRTPHIHREFELCLFLTGETDVRIQGNLHRLNAGSLLLLNPYQVHELQAVTSVQILCLQISPGFFKHYFPQIKDMTFDSPVITDNGSASLYELKKQIVNLSRIYLQKEPLYELSCASLLNDVFLRLLQINPFSTTSETELAAKSAREQKIRFLTDQIEQRCGEKLLLKDLAQEMGLSLYYLSHFFIDQFGLSFQQYLSKVRCEKARKLMLLTDHSILDISISAGFSDSKYLNAAFRKQYGCAPREYRKGFQRESIDAQQASMLSTQEFLSAETSLVLLDRILRGER